ncbi:LLM class flavin-dependent oxidoreductase (plasmid) [Rhizobium sp. ACO-34A]|nr:NtaA/DmoA family FMN-dependent monooxygenase [Rhizobium sp. ACO-34A]ATN36633.1 LLM class flavin-dependent oxidoreductase [Rhizobium sp. ACO-34A]
MTVRKKLHVGMSLAPTWLSGDAWRRPDSGIESVFGSDFYVDIARRAEAAKLDFVFRPDSLFLNTQVLETSQGFASLDSTVLLAAIARETSHIGLLTTASTMFVPPYMLARQIMSLHWLSNGRVGWNIVTALDGNENFGLPAMPSSEERYARAAEYTELVRLLWQSFPEEALKRDRESGRYADPGRIRPVNHNGPHFSVKGPLNLPAFDRAPIPLVQAGASEVGRNFASSVADAIFAATPDIEAATDLRRDLRQRAEGHGRRADDIRLLPGLSLYLAATRKEAQELFAFTHARGDRNRKIAHILKLTGLDLADWSEDRRITAADLPSELPAGASKTHAELLKRVIMREEPLLRDLLGRPEVIGSGHWQIVGTVDDAVQEISAWADAGAIDGFITTPGGSPGSMGLALEELMPRLSDAGLLRKDYAGSTFAGHFCEQ